MKKTKLVNAIAIALGVGVVASPVQAQIEEILVTATKRSESTQDIAVAVNAIGESALDELDIDNFTDYLLQMPGVTASSTGPGQGTIYIRGIASTPVLLTTSGAAGLAPNVALYLDEQPVTQVGRNLDVYAADLNRIEVLPGPQGTLFGASSQAGTVRLITNKPDFSGTYGNVSAGISFTEGGDMSNKVEAVLNVPVNDKLAVRGVFYNDSQGGYIDNIPGTITARDSARFRPAGFVRPNGVVVGDQAGFQAGADLSNVNFIPVSNLGLAEDNFNDALYTGARVSGTYNFNDTWSLNVTHTRQKLETEGVWFGDPTLDSDLTKVQRYSAEENEDEFSNTSWTVQGTVGSLEVVYAGAFLDRDSNYVVDYTDYLFVGQYLPYYICDGSVTYPGAGGPAGNCQNPQQFVDGRTAVEVTTHELRFSTPSENRLRATFGAFVSEQELKEQNDFTYPGSILAESFTPGVFGFPINFPLPGSSVSNPNPRPRGVVFFNDLVRTDDQFGLFAEATYRFSDKFSTTLGIRHHDVRVDLVGSANSAFFNFGLPDGQDSQAFGANLDQIFDGNDINERTGESFGGVIPDDAQAKGEVVKATFSWTPNENSLFYATYSEGFRPGLPNRPALSGGGAVPAIVRTDEVTNIEIGWKTTLLDNTLQFNGSVFSVDIQDLQTTIFDPSVTNLLFSDNAADAEVKGLEADFIWAPESIEGLTVNGAVSFLDTEITELVGASIAIAPPGSELSYAPSFQGNLRARYEWQQSDRFMAHWQAQVTHSESSYSDLVSINRAEQDSYTILNAAYGISTEKWRAEIFMENVTDERAELNNNLNYDRERIAINRPRTVGLRVTFDFD